MVEMEEIIFGGGVVLMMFMGALVTILLVMREMVQLMHYFLKATSLLLIGFMVVPG